MYKIVYVVRGGQGVYGEFETEDEAMEYAEENADKGVVVEAADCELNDFGEVTEVNEKEIVWQSEATDGEQAEASRGDESEYGEGWYESFDDAQREAAEPAEKRVEVTVKVCDGDELCIAEWPSEFEPRADYDVAAPAVKAPAAAEAPESAELVVAAEVPAEVANEVSGGEEVKVEIPEKGVDAEAEVITAEDTSEDDSEIEDAELGEEEAPLDEDTHAKYAMPEGNKIAAYNNALRYAKKEGRPMIYGYTDLNGKFFALNQPSPEKEASFRGSHKNCSVVYVAYPDKSFAESLEDDITDEQLAEALWDAKNHDSVNESVVSDTKEYSIKDITSGMGAVVDRGAASSMRPIRDEHSQKELYQAASSMYVRVCINLAHRDEIKDLGWVLLENGVVWGFEFGGSRFAMAAKEGAFDAYAKKPGDQRYERKLHADHSYCTNMKDVEAMLTGGAEEKSGGEATEALEEAKKKTALITDKKHGFVRVQATALGNGLIATKDGFGGWRVSDEKTGTLVKGGLENGFRTLADAKAYADDLPEEDRKRIELARSTQGYAAKAAEVAAANPEDYPERD